MRIITSGNPKVLSTMWRHRRWVVAAFLTLVVAGAWSVITRPRWKLLDGQEQVVGFSADGRVLATIDRDGLGHLWDPETGQSLDDLSGKVTGLPFPFSPDGRYHVARLPDPENDTYRWRAAVFETKTKRQLFEFSYDPGMTFTRRLLGFSANSKYFFAQRVMKEHVSCVWELPDGGKIYEQESRLAAISDDGKLLAKTSKENEIEHFALQVINVVDGDAEHTMQRRMGWAQGTVFSSDNGHVLEVAEQGTKAIGKAVLYDLEAGEMASVEGTPYPYYPRPIVPRFIHGDRLIEVVRLHPEFPAVAVCTASAKDFRLVWNARCISKNRKWCFRNEYARGSQTVLQVFEISPEIASKSTGQELSPMHEFTYDSLLYPRQAAISDDGRIVAIATRQTGVMVFDMIDKKLMLERPIRPSMLNEIYLSPNGRYVAVSTVREGEKSEVHIMRLPSPQDPRVR